MALTYDLDELAELVRNCDRLAGADIAFPIAATLADVWADTARARVPVDTGQTWARTGVESVRGRGGHASADVISDTPYAGFIDRGTAHVPPRPYFRQGREAALEVARGLGGEIATTTARVLDSGGVWNPRSAFGLR